MWSKLGNDVRSVLLAKYEGGILTKDDALALGMNPASLKRRLREHRELLTTSKPIPALSDLYFADPDTDQLMWVEGLRKLKQQHRHISVMHVCDVHFPYQHDPSLEVTYQLMSYLQPHVIVVGSDSADLSLLSTFPNDPDEVSNGDVLDEFESHWIPHINRIRYSCPKAIIVYILGNHEKRIYDFIMRQAPAIRRTVWSRFVNIIRHGDNVLWIGETDTVRIGPLLVTHGNRGGTNPAMGLWMDVGGQCSVMAGHVHRLSYFGKRGEEYMTEAITSGCLTNYPHYHKRKRSSSKWQLGTAIAEVDLGSREVVFHNLKFELEPNRVWVRFERQTFEAPVAAPVGFDPVKDYLA